MTDLEGGRIDPFEKISLFVKLFLSESDSPKSNRLNLRIGKIGYVNQFDENDENRITTKIEYDESL